MHDDHDAEVGKGRAPTLQEFPDNSFAGFVGEDMLALDMPQFEVTGKLCMMPEIPRYTLNTSVKFSIKGAGR